MSGRSGLLPASAWKSGIGQDGVVHEERLAGLLAQELRLEVVQFTCSSLAIHPCVRMPDGCACVINPGR
jgi:hypothetical protein